MASKTLTVHIGGVAPILLHNGALADPQNEIVIGMQKLTRKQAKKKTVDDHRALADLEWEGGLYIDDDGDVCIPGENIEAMFIAAGKASRRGKDFTAGMFCEGSWKLIHDGPKNIDKLRGDPRYRYRRGVRVGTARVIRTRPIFRVWGLRFDISYMSNLSFESVVEALKEAGEMVGLGDYRPRYGRFKVVDDAAKYVKEISSA